MLFCRKGPVLQIKKSLKNPKWIGKDLNYEIGPTQLILHDIKPVPKKSLWAELDVKDYTTMYDFHNSTDTLKFWTEKWAINKTFLFFISFWWNLVKLKLSMCTTILPSFIKIGWKTKKVLLIARFSVQNFKVSVKLWKSYIVLYYVCLTSSSATWQVDIK